MKSLIAAAFAASLLSLTVGEALAETRIYIGAPDGRVVADGRGRPGERHNDARRGHHAQPPKVAPRQRDRNDEFAASMLGFLGGIAVGSVLENGGKVPVVRQPESRYDYRRSHLRPWSHAWYRWCDARYRSFDPRSGTYVGMDGRRRFCEAS